MVSTVEDTGVKSGTAIPVEIGKPRGGPEGRRTLRQDRWWLSPAVTVTVLTSFIAYATFAAFQGRYYYVGAQQHRNLISPFYSPCIANSCQRVAGSHPLGIWASFWNFSPALLILIVPLGFRLTCYYYRKAYYRSFWQSPPACGVADGHKSYTGETRFPLILQNIHRYFLYLALLFNVVLTMDAVLAFNFPGQGIGFSVGTLVLCVNAALLWIYTVSCHACRHLCGGQLNKFSKHPIRYRFWKAITPLNARHMQLAWVSLIFVALTDLYVRLVASGIIHDYKIF